MGWRSALQVGHGLKSWCCMQIITECHDTCLPHSDSCVTWTKLWRPILDRVVWCTIDTKGKLTDQNNRLHQPSKSWDQAAVTREYYGHLSEHPGNVSSLQQTVGPKPKLILDSFVSTVAQHWPTAEVLRCDEGKLKIKELTFIPSEPILGNEWHGFQEVQNTFKKKGETKTRLNKW